LLLENIRQTHTEEPLITQQDVILVDYYINNTEESGEKKTRVKEELKVPANLFSS